MLFLLLCCVFVSVTLTAHAFLKKSPSELFRRYILDPIPASVKNIKAHRPWELSGHRYVFHFDINKADLELILNSRPFKKVMDIKYSNGYLHWREDALHGRGLPLYSPYKGKPGPDWFRPARWDNPKAYVFIEELRRTHMQILMYHEEHGQVYFVEYKEGH